MAVIVELLGGVRATVFAALLLICVPIAAVWAYGSGSAKWEGKFNSEVAAHKATKQGHAEVMTRLAALTKAAAEAVRGANKQYASDRSANDLAHKEELSRAKSNRSSLDRDLRTGRVQLRDHWTSYQPFGAPGGTFAVAGGQDGYADLRIEGALQDVQAGAEADAWIGWLQRELIATRTAVIRAGCAVESVP